MTNPAEWTCFFILLLLLLLLLLFLASVYRYISLGCSYWKKPLEQQ